MAEERPMQKWRCAYVTLMVLGVIVAVVGIVLLFELPKLVHSDIKKKIPIRNGSETYNDWVEPAVPVYMRFWVFDLINANEYVQSGLKPILKEKGPYTYREFRPKEDIVFSEDNALVSYREPKTYVFVPELSNGTENDTFTTVNFPLLTLATRLRFFPSFLQKLLRDVFILVGEKLFTEYTVGGYLWGFEDPTLRKINSLTEKVFHKPLFKDDKFGLFYRKTGNGTDDGIYTIHTGQKNLTLYNEIYQWQNKSSLPFWNTPYCNMINGSDGSGWHPFIKKTDTLYIFSSDVCRSIYVTYTNEETISGIPMYRFSPPPSVMQEPTENPDNIGFCTPDCLKDGVLNISTCKDGAPVIISQPHFYQGDASFINAFDGLHPDASKHATVLDIEPNTGAALNVDKKLQLNFYIRNLISVRETNNMVNDTVFPVIWLSESAMLTDSQASEFRSKILIPIKVTVIIPWILIGLGILLFLTGLGILLFVLLSATEQGVKEPPAKEEDEHSPLLTEASETPAYAPAENA